MYRAKVIVLGPCKAGKTTLANFLTESTEIGAGEYFPTQGCRILECEQHVNLDGRNVTAELEVWDVSGDHKFESCWPAIARDTNGVIFVFNPDQPNHDKELESWWSYFVEHSHVRDEQCVVFAYHRRDAGPQMADVSSSSLSRVTCIHTNLDEDGETCREEFRSYITQLLTVMSEKRDREELSIIQ